jgi:hypothetical protein
MTATTEWFEDRAMLVGAGTVIEFYSNGLVVVRRRMESSLVVQHFRPVDGKWQCLTDNRVDDAAPVEITISVQGDGSTDKLPQLVSAPDYPEIVAVMLEFNTGAQDDNALGKEIERQRAECAR